MAISNNQIIHQKIVKGSFNGELFLKFIKELSKKLKSTGDKKYILLDNARIHHYRKVKEFINNETKINLIYNIPYTPETNPIERVFSDVKKNLRNKKIDNDNIVGEINKSIKNINVNNFKAYYEKSLISEIKKLK